MKNLQDDIQGVVDALTTTLAAIQNNQVIASGTFTTDSATVPADTVLGGLKATGYYNSCVLMPLTGVCAYQPRKIKTYTATTGVMTLEDETPFTSAPGLVSYVILMDTKTIGLNKVVPATPTAGSLYDILSKAAGGNTFDKSTDSLEAIADTLGSALALTGDAAVANVLTGKTFYKDDFKTKLTGTMANNAGDVASVSGHMDAGTNLHVVPATGYTDGVDDATTIDLAVVDADLAAGNVKSGVALLGVTGSYDTEAGNPIAAGTVLNGKIGYVNGAKVTGTMPNNAGDVAAVSAHMDVGTVLHVLPAAGYADGADDAATIDLATVDADLAAANVKTGVAVLGVTGTYDTEAGSPCAAGTVLNGKVGFVNGAKITGTMPNNAGAVAAVSASITAGTTLSVIPAEGYTDGSDDTSTIDLTTVDADLVTTNIKSGITILGVAGTASVVDTADANAVEGDIANGKTAYVNGVKITGTHV